MPTMGTSHLATGRHRDDRTHRREADGGSVEPSSLKLNRTDQHPGADHLAIRWRSLPVRGIVDGGETG